MGTENLNLEKANETVKILINIAQKHGWTVKYEDDLNIYLTKKFVIGLYGDEKTSEEVEEEEISNIVTVTLTAHAYRFRPLPSTVKTNDVYGYGVNIYDIIIYNKYNERVDLMGFGDIKINTNNIKFETSEIKEAEELASYITIEDYDINEFTKELERFLSKSANDLISDLIDLIAFEVQETVKSELYNSFL